MNTEHRRGSEHSGIHALGSEAERDANGEQTEEEKNDNPAQASLRRRISYFMLFRLAVLFALTILAGVSSYFQDNLVPDPVYPWLTWGSLAIAYTLTLVYAWRLPHISNLPSLAQVQTTVDIILSAVVIQLTGGADSRFSFLYLIAILGAATMGDRRQIWIAAGSSLAIYSVMSGLQVMGFVMPLTPSGVSITLDTTELIWAAFRNTAQMGGIVVISAYLNSQLLTSVSQVGSLRALNEDIVRSLSSGLLTIDLNGKVLFSNPTAIEILRLDYDPAGLDVEEILPGASKYLDAPDEKATRFELQLPSDSLRPIHLGLSSCPLQDSEATVLGHVINFQDVTELRKLAQLVDKNERLAAIGQLSASVAHEVRNPLAAISGSAELLSSADLQDDDLRLLDVIQRESQRLNKTVSDLLVFTKNEPLDKSRVPVGRSVQHVLDALQADPISHNVAMTHSGLEYLDVNADPNQLYQVWWNLLRNAAEAMDGTGRITIRGETDGTEAKIYVSDNGPGIPDDIRARIFEPLFSTKTQGSGFGLAVVRRILEEHEGSIDVSSSDEGTVFIVSLPRFDYER